MANADMNEDDLDNRFTYHKPFGSQGKRYEDLRWQAKQFAALIYEHCPESRERSLAITNVEQASMWANASIARNEKQAGEVK